jgi:hypothetical protein
VILPMRGEAEMAKIPVGETVASAYGFALRNFLVVLGVIWVPFTIVGVAGYFLLPPYLAAMRNMIAGGDPRAMGSGSLFLMSFALIVLLCFNMMYVGIARLALGVRKGSVFYYFSADRAFWRLLGAYFVFFLIMLGMIVAATMIARVLAAAGVGFPVVITGLIIVCLIVFVGTRMMFLSAPVTVAEGRRVVSRSWSLTRGNFWRIFAVLLAIVIPLMIVQMILETVVVAFMHLPTAPPQGATPAQVAEYLQSTDAQFFAIFPLVFVMGLMMYGLIAGLMVSASAFAYRALVPPAEGIAAEFV